MGKGFKSFKVTALGLALLLGLFPPSLQGADQKPSFPEVTLGPRDRILILAPHPDDEVLGCGGIIQQAVRMGLPLRVVFLTYGDSNELSFLLYRMHPVLMPKAAQGMGEVRHAEALAAAKILQVPAEQILFLGYPDWGALLIWYQHWGNRPPHKSVLTRAVSVPYPDAFRPGAAYKGEEILKDLKAIVRDFAPTKVFVSHPADTHPDHRALYLFVRVALWDLESQKVHPELHPYLIHYRKWPLPSRRPLTEMLQPPASLTQVSWRAHSLSDEEAARKLEAIKAHKSQYRLGPKSLASFVRLNELFGDFLSEGLTEEERIAFGGLERRSVWREGENLVLSMEFSRPLAKEMAVSVYLFGYRRGHPFERMPKLHLKIGVVRHEVYDQGSPWPSRLIQVSREAKQITVRVPLELLGNPDRILTSIQTSLAEFALDPVSWRVLDLLESSP